MKTLIFLVSCMCAVLVMQAQNYEISFSGSGQSNTVDSVQVLNLTQGTMLSLNGDDVLNLVQTLGINTLHTNNNNLKVYPNPMVELAYVEFVNSSKENVTIEIINELGILIAKQSRILKNGIQRFVIMGLDAGVYTVNLNTTKWKCGTKLISLGKHAGNITIKHQYIGDSEIQERAISNTKELVPMQYNDGEMILLKGFSDNYARVLTFTPTQSQNVDFEFVPCIDEDGNSYAVVTIGTQTWMAENLNYVTGHSWCYDDTPANCDVYGRLYDWPAIMNGASSSNEVPSGVQGICPDGWHIPSNSEWNILVDYLGGSDIAGGKMKETGTNHWNLPNEGATNESGFTGLPGGVNFYEYGSVYIREMGSWWSATESGPTCAFSHNAFYDKEMLHEQGSGTEEGRSVRCVKD